MSHDPARTPRVRVALVHDRPSIAARIGAAIRADARLELTIEACGIVAARAAIGPGAVDVVVIDAHLADGHGVRLGAQLRRSDPAVSIVLLSGRRGPEFLVDLPMDVRRRWTCLDRRAAEADPAIVAAAAVAAAAGTHTIDPGMLSARRPRAGSPLATLDWDSLEALLAAASAGDADALATLLTGTSRG